MMLKAERLSKHFIMHNQDGISLPVFVDVSFTVNRAEAVILHGDSGVGKSTLLRILYGNYKPSTGHVYIAHQDETVDIVSAEPRRVLDVRRKTLSFVSQFLRVIPRVKTIDIVKDPMLSRGLSNAEATTRAQAILEHVNLSPRLWNLAPSTFSGGEQQRVNIARSFVDPTDIMLLDEPTASLDARNRDIVVELINQARNNGAAIIGIFHDESVRDRIATRRLDLSQFKKAA